MLRYPESCLLCGSALLVTGHLAAGYTLAGLSLVFAFFRFSIKLQQENAKKEEAQQVISSAADVIKDALLTGGVNSGRTGKKILH
tara:strand:- start:2421 stop:2675 length:255 start_codon:yes stop_codon:yes gene_type:complete